MYYKYYIIYKLNDILPAFGCFWVIYLPGTAVAKPGTIYVMRRYTVTVAHNIK